MQITQYIEWAGEIQVSVAAEDIIASLKEAPDSKGALVQALNNLASFINAVPDELIAELNDAQRTLIRDFLQESSRRFRRES